MHGLDYAGSNLALDMVGAEVYVLGSFCSSFCFGYVDGCNIINLEQGGFYFGSHYL